MVTINGHETFFCFFCFYLEKTVTAELSIFMGNVNAKRYDDNRRSFSETN